MSLVSGYEKGEFFKMNLIILNSGLSILSHFNTHFIVSSHATRGKSLHCIIVSLHFAMLFTYSNKVAHYFYCVFIYFLFTYLWPHFSWCCIILCLLDHFFSRSFYSVHYTIWAVLRLKWYFELKNWKQRCVFLTL